MVHEPILVVDDNPTNLKLVRILLEDEGFSVRAASHAAGAVEILDQLTPRLVLMDIQLPGLDGLELTRRLRRDRRFDHTWIVALTAHALPGDEAKVQAAGCDGYISKPIDAELLPRMVAAYLERERAGQQA